MLTLVRVQPSARSSADAAGLVSDYLAFDRRRTARRQYMKAFGGMALIVVVGAVFGRVPVGEALIVAGLLILPPVVLAAIELIQWRRLARRLNNVRGEVHSVRKS